MIKNKLTILLVEDQHSLASNIAEYMEHSGHIMDFAINGEQAIELALSQFYDLIILDINLPKVNGLDVCATLRREANRHIPILMLTARDSIDDKVTGFHAGADDYLTKPFSLQELEVRCEAVSRRYNKQPLDRIELGDLVIDKQKQRIYRQEQLIPVHTMGFKILTILAQAYPQVVTRAELSQKLWGDEPTESDAMRSHIYQLRSVLDKPFPTPMVQTVHGVGFTLSLEE